MTLRLAIVAARTLDQVTDVRAGRLKLTVDQAVSTVDTYIRHLDGRHSWPYYDAYDTGSDSCTLNDGDLLSPVLMNVPMTMEAFAGLQAHRGQLERGLGGLPVEANLDLADADDEVVAKIASLFEVLSARIPGVQGTTLAKVLHRKRPRLMPLYDDRLWRVYSEEHGGPVVARPRVGRRTWSEFMLAYTTAIRADLQASRDAWITVCSSVTSPTLTPLRALDIVAWSHANDEDLPP